MKMNSQSQIAVFILSSTLAFTVHAHSRHGAEDSALDTTAYFVQGVRNGVEVFIHSRELAASYGAGTLIEASNIPHVAELGVHTGNFVNYAFSLAKWSIEGTSWPYHLAFTAANAGLAASQGKTIQRNAGLAMQHTMAGQHSLAVFTGSIATYCTVDLVGHVVDAGISLRNFWRSLFKA
jgi:hypothetical protein